MAYTFGFGIKCAAPILALAVFTTNIGMAASPAPVTGGVDVNLRVSGLRNVKGQLMICLTKNPRAFPDCSKDQNAIKKRVSASSAANVAFPGIAPGTYAAAIVHDENTNNKMDLSLFLPKEGFAFSRNPAVVMGPPKFKSAAFAVGNADVKQSVKMKYML